MRKLASVQAVASVEPIPDADAVEKLRVLGWSVVSRKGEHKAGDRIVYCEIDSLLPVRPEFEFLRPSSYKPEQKDAVGNTLTPEGFRIRTLKIRKQVSQGICFPLSVLPPGDYEEGQDVTELLGVRKWDPPAALGMGGKVKGALPYFVPKTDEVRIQAVPGVLRRHAGTPFYVTEKLDGTSMSVFLKGGEFGVCSRNLWLDTADDGSLLVQVAKALDLEKKLRAIGADVVVQGELVGPGIQGNKYKLDARQFRPFNLVYADSGDRAPHGTLIYVCDRLGLKPVPAVFFSVLGGHETADSLVSQAAGRSELNPSVPREGLVWRAAETPTYDDEIGGPISFKVINPEFLLKFDA